MYFLYLILATTSCLKFFCFSVSAIELFSFGANEWRDARISSDDDECKTYVRLDEHVVFYGKKYYHFYVCTNGMLSFRYFSSTFVWEVFRESVIAIFASDIDLQETKNNGTANHGYWRKDSSKTTLDRVNSLIRGITLRETFSATWTFVVTYYKVFQIDNQGLNTFQLVISGDDFNHCFCLFLYKDIQWTESDINTGAARGHHAIAGFNDGQGRSLWIPGSNTSDVSNWSRKSNVGVDGLFIYRLPPEDSCFTIQPKYVDAYFEERKFELAAWCGSSNFNFPLQKVDVIFIGSSYNVTVSGYAENGTQVITGFFPYWGKSEKVMVLPVIEGTGMKDASMVEFVSLDHDQKKQNEAFLNSTLISQSSYSVTLKLEWDTNFWGSKFKIELSMIYILVFTVQDQIDRNDPFENFGVTVHVEANSGVLEKTFNLKRGSTFIQLDSSFDCKGPVVYSFRECAVHPLVSNGPVAFVGEACEQWYEREERILQLHDKPWFEVVGESYGCPQNVLRNRSKTDAWYARAEVALGFNGWQLDPCCGGTPINNFCQHCRMNKGADFCIQSPGIMMEEFDEDNDVIRIVASNQCCYDSFGNLLTSESKGAGVATKLVKSLDNTMDASEKEIEENSCGFNYATEQVTVGTYLPRKGSINWGVPHLKTMDGFEYRFNGLGVYLMVETVGQDVPSLSMHVSTRRWGDGTVFSGFFVKDFLTSLEFLITAEKSVHISINGNVLKCRSFIATRTNGVHFSRNESCTEFSFKLERSDFVVKVFITESGILNLGVSPPKSFQNQMKGLLGNFDGVPDNDLQVVEYGFTLPTGSPAITIHEFFGQQMSIPKDQWMFSNFTSNLIEKDLLDVQSFEPVYEKNFTSDMMALEAYTKCGADKRCMLGVSLTGKMEFAENFQQIKPLLDATDELNCIAVDY